MMTASDYKSLARQCLQWADETKDEKAREDFLQLAHDWILASLCLEQGVGLLYRKHPNGPFRSHLPAPAQWPTDEDIPEGPRHP